MIPRNKVGAIASVVLLISTIVASFSPNLIVLMITQGIIAGKIHELYIHLVLCCKCRIKKKCTMTLHYLIESNCKSGIQKNKQY